MFSNFLKRRIFKINKFDIVSLRTRSVNSPKRPTYCTYSMNTPLFVIFTLGHITSIFPRIKEFKPRTLMKFSLWRTTSHKILQLHLIHTMIHHLIKMRMGFNYSLTTAWSHFPLLRPRKQVNLSININMRPTNNVVLTRVHILHEQTIQN